MYREIYLTDRRRNIMISGVRKCMALLMTLLCIVMMYPQAVFAAEKTSQHETVKVGFFAMDGYHMMDEEGNRSGYNVIKLRINIYRINRY